MPHHNGVSTAPQANEWRDALQKEIAVHAYLDVANMIGWQNRLGWNFNVGYAITDIRFLPHVKEVNAYYGFNDRTDEDRVKSEGFHVRIQKAGARLTTKPVKFIRREIGPEFLLRRSTLSRIDQGSTTLVEGLVESLQAFSGGFLEEPKCNFDVEMAMDIMDDLDKVSGVLLFSGDSDFVAPVARLKLKGKRVYLVGVRGRVASELLRLADFYVDFGKLYTGPRYYRRDAKIPPGGGTA